MIKDKTLPHRKTSNRNSQILQKWFILGSSHHGSAVKNPTSIHEDVGSIPHVSMSCGVCHRHGSDPTLLWLWRRPAAVSPIRPLAWEFPYAAGVALKSSGSFYCQQWMVW